MPKDAAATRSSSDYLEQSRLPLHVLVFLAPAMAFYAVGTVLFAPAVAPAAERTIGAIFGVFGVVGMHLPSAAIVVFLLTQHLIRKDGWNVSLSTLGLMVVESAVWVVPLLVLSRALAFGGALADVDATSLGLGARLTVAVGAGLFEETLYRLVLIMVIHMLAVDVVGLKDRAGWGIGIVASAAIFAMVHRVPAEMAGSEGMVRGFYFAAALYFGGLFAGRGLGIVIGAHVLYDVAALA